MARCPAPRPAQARSATPLCALRSSLNSFAFATVTTTLLAPSSIMIVTGGCKAQYKLFTARRRQPLIAYMDCSLSNGRDSSLAPDIFFTSGNICPRPQCFRASFTSSLLAVRVIFRYRDLTGRWPATSWSGNYREKISIYHRHCTNSILVVWIKSQNQGPDRRLAA